DLIYVNVKDLPVFIPNTFSPNDDGFNDFFTVFGDPTVFKVKMIHIFNRWGDLVFETTDILPSDETKGWDGKFKGLVQSDGMYVYNLEIELFDKSTRQLKGEVFLLK
ncbi:MAG: gliding motility-associated C-terminal domain-containing protein, partial [Saprospiraceae bacterium]